MNFQQLPAPEEFYVRAGTAAVSRARRRITVTARHWNVPLSDSALADVELCASEIIANALTHAGNECWVRAHWTGQFFQVEVTDHSLCPPAPSEASLDDTSGRGLALVEGLSHCWGWVPKELGKTVFFIVADEAVLSSARRRSALARVAQDRVEGAQGGAGESAAQGRRVHRRRIAVASRLSGLGWS
jgi:anti-sigma regulatory factor (Ser/Thr protein kinase)